jgi:2-amino-4-hydroxy-6-hydroxymethyldihydropteridine diphosphokinase
MGLHGRMMAMPKGYLGLGSNVGERLEYLRRAVGRLKATAGIRVMKLSAVYETEPVGVTDQGWFLNAAVEIHTSLSAEALLYCTQEIERDLGRVVTRRWGPRVIDLDILLFGNARVQTATLQIPHPELRNRAFVMIPLLELDPDLALPDGTSIGACLAALPSRPCVRVYAPPTALDPGHAPSYMNALQ